jgi:hypothetical protein
VSSREPGHYRPGADSNHFLGHCDECDAHYLLNMTLEQVENWYHQGVIGQAMYEAYCHIWATSAFRYGRYESWERPPACEDAQALVELFRSIIAARAAA